MGLLVCVMGLLLLKVEATCLISQHRKQTVTAPRPSNRAATYHSESGLVLCCIVAVRWSSANVVFVAHSCRSTNRPGRQQCTGNGQL